MIKSINLTDFRNFKKRTFDFSEKATVIVGPNAIGKTNILESLFLLSTGKSFKAKVEAEMIKYEQDLGRVEGTINVGPVGGSSRSTFPVDTAGAQRDSLRSRHPISLEAVITTGDNGWPKKKLMGKWCAT
jgi:recombinational DNA repair ATPase RecF